MQLATDTAQAGPFGGAKPSTAPAAGKPKANGQAAVEAVFSGYAGEQLQQGLSSAAADLAVYAHRISAQLQQRGVPKDEALQIAQQVASNAFAQAIQTQPGRKK